jgi:hypothetical protein
MAFRQIKILSQERGKDYVFPSPEILQDVLDSYRVGISEEFSVFGKASINYSFTYFENYDTSINTLATPIVTANFTPLEFTFYNLSETTKFNATINTTFIPLEFTFYNSSETVSTTATVNTTFVKFENPNISETTNFNATVNAVFV